MTKEQLKKNILKSLADSDIAQLYMYEKDATELFDEQTLMGYYQNILDLALEGLTNTLESHTKFELEDVQSFATVRALYEYAMEHYHAQKLSDAAALFEVLGGITTDENFSKALKVHAAAAAGAVSLENFLQEYADMHKVQQSGNFYIADFTNKVQELLVSSKEES